VHGAEHAIEQVELQRLLAEAVLALDEPYRSAVVLRHLEQLSPAQIAQRQKCSVEAARQRVTRGLQQLRARLDHKFDGNRDAWRALLVPFAQHAPLVGAGVAAGVGVVSAKLVLGTTACVAAACLLWWSPWNARDGAQLAGREQRGATRELELPTSREPLEQPTAAIAAQVAARRALPGPQRLTGTVKDSSGRPLPRAKLDFSSPDDEASVAASSVSDAAGQFEAVLAVDWPAEKLIDAFVRSAGFVASSTSVRVGEPAAITLHRFPRVEVRVITSDGSIPQGVVGLTLSKPNAEQREAERIMVDLDADGVARSGPLELGTLKSVGVDVAGYSLVHQNRSDELVGDQRLLLDVEVRPGVVLRGIVRNELTGRPVPGALVRAGIPTEVRIFGERASSTDGLGRFELRGVSPTGTNFVPNSPGVCSLYLVEVEAPGFVFPAERRLVLKHLASKPAPASAEDIELLVIPLGGSVSGKLRWADGRECGEKFRVRALDSLGNSFEALRKDDCRYYFDGLPADDLLVFATPLRSDPYPGMSYARLRLAAGEERELDLVLSKGSGVIEGRVIDSQAQSAAGIYVEAHFFVEHASKRTWIDGLSACTDAQGFFRLEGLSPGVYDVMLETDAWPTPFGSRPPQRRLSLEQGQISSAVDFQVEPAVHYAGKLAPWPAQDPTLPVLLEMTHAEFGLVAGVWVKEDGSFVYPPVCGAAYVLIARQGERELGRATTTPAGSRELLVPLSN
jgi:hypothetical protein